MNHYLFSLSRVFTELLQAVLYPSSGVLFVCVRCSAGNPPWAFLARQRCSRLWPGSQAPGYTEVCGKATAAQGWALGLMSPSPSPRAEPRTASNRHFGGLWQQPLPVQHDGGIAHGRLIPWCSLGFVKFSLKSKRKLLGQHRGECHLHLSLYWWSFLAAHTRV